MTAALTQQPDHYYSGLNLNLLNSVSAGVKCVLELGCGSGNLGAALKIQQPACKVFGVEMHAAAASEAKDKLDVVYQSDIAGLDELFCHQALEPFDCVIVGDVFEHLPQPTQMLQSLRKHLTDNAVVCTSVPNFAHFSVLRALLSDHFQYHDVGILDRTHIHMFTQSSISKMFLDAGFMPRLHSYIYSELPAALTNLLQAFAMQENTDAGRVLRNASVYQYIFVAHKQSDPVYSPVSDNLDIVCAVNNEMLLSNNLLASPLLTQHPHRIHTFTGMRSIAETLETAKPQLQGDWLILAHQDVYLPAGWFERVLASWQAVEAKLGAVGVAGVFGKAMGAKNDNYDRFGRVLNYDQTLDTGAGTALLADSLDELVLVFKRDHLPTLNPSLGFHLYGTEVCHWAKQQGLHSIIVDAPCLHNTNTHPGNVSSDLLTAAQHYLAIYQPPLPMTTTSLHIDADAQIRII